MNEHEKLVSRQKRQSKQEERNQNEFSKKLSDLFDMMPSNVEDLIEKDRLREPEIRAEDIRFVQDQGERKTGKLISSTLQEQKLQKSGGKGFKYLLQVYNHHHQ